MKIEVWSDVVCPFCFIGKRHLEEAIEQSGFDGQIDVVYKAYELDPTAPATTDEPYHVSLARKYQISDEQAEEMVDNILQRARGAGLYYRTSEWTMANTFNAHRVTKYAAEEGKENEMVERFFSSYLEEAKKIGTDEVILSIAEEAGLNVEKVKEVLEGEAYADEVRQDIAEAKQVGVQGVPFFVFNRKYAVPGAMPTESFVEVIQKVAEEEGLEAKPQVLDIEGSGMCTDGKCEM
ncbi:thioredoxin domain-containing protein [Planococcaceae bacterium Storch 2/2-2]|nr:thioredoxin domain-containing protein [Planococcaceae bacterium Storch 2/2-2]